MPNEALIVAAVRTPIGALGGVLSTVPATELGATCIRELLQRSGVAADELDEVIMGNVVSGGIGQNPARQCSIYAGVPASVGATTINKVCGSSLKAVMFAEQAIRLGDSHVVIAGGTESMSLAPYLLPQARQGYRIGHGKLIDSMIQDGLWDAYGNAHMGTYGDQCAAEYSFSREEQDAFAIRSYLRARQATSEGIFDDEIVTVSVPQRKGTKEVSDDEEPTRFNEDKLRELRPAFSEQGTVTAGNASSVNDGAAALLVVSDSHCASLRLRPIARIVGSVTFSREPEWFTIAPIGAIHKLVDKIGWSIDEVDLFEINEAFANVAMAAARDLKVPEDKLNIYGGAVALGHPIGATGARILVTLLTGLSCTGGKRGIACLCIGGGEAVAMAVERME
ncbi:acetyl-CoA acetyltransferase [Rhodopirellula maiorica SM1]|uniref:Acetyl-CoA acetyltransferase n=1 Tax=Rhodopirellula maiorica SM1 TaxID=1265738 RepID=M5R7V0_9BACT|nr:thiolase family protein [Rhodopirellula maiorica]EMI15563.1 acetyl-CoA acetyltransferase [Rhodopirellula maiorica SM1]